MPEALATGLHTAIAVLELASAALFMLGFIVATIIWGRESLLLSDPKALTNYRQALARTILIGLEVLVVATVVKTVILDPTIESMGSLLAMVAIRTALGWATSLEMNGRWPWQKPAEA